MDVAVLFVRLLLAAVFFIAAGSKLADRRASRQTLVEFGVPASFAGSLGRLLPIAELAVAGALVASETAWWGALAALALLLLFTVVIGANLARGRQPDCRCFGQLSSSPVGWKTLARNGALAGVAGFVLSQGTNQTSPMATDVSSLTVTEVGLALGGILLLAFLTVQAFLLVNLVRQNGRLLLRLEHMEQSLAVAGIVPPVDDASAEEGPGLAVGSRAPAFQLSGVWGEMLTLDSLRAAGKPVALLFTDPNCGPCNALLPDVGRWQQEHAAALTIAVVSRGEISANRAKSAEHGLSNVLVQAASEVSQAYEETGTPSAVIVRPDGTIGSSLVAGADPIRALIARAVGLPFARPPAPAPEPPPLASAGNGAASPPAPAASTVGQPAPPVKLPDLRGRTINLAGYRGTRTLLLFWNPACGFCQQMLDDLKAWDTDPPEGAPKLLVVSTGSVEANEALGLRSPVLLDQDFGVAATFGANGTPMAVLVDEEGRVASEVAAGAQAVFALAHEQPAPV
jgi:peroxiredoxin